MAVGVPADPPTPLPGPSRTSSRACVLSSGACSQVSSSRVSVWGWGVVGSVKSGFPTDYGWGRRGTSRPRGDADLVSKALAVKPRAQLGQCQPLSLSPVAGLIDSLIYHSARAIQKKIDLGKTT